VVLCLSDYVKRRISRHYPLTENRLAWLFNAVDLDRFAPQEPSGVLRSRLGTDKPILLMIANDLRRKGFGQAIQAMARLGDNAPALAVIGRESIKPWRRHIPPGAIVHYLGLVDDPRPYYADADALILPTRHDPCSLVVLESLAMGLPVISTRQNGACEIMTDAVHGRVLDDPDDIDALAHAIRMVLDRKRLSKMRSACLALRPKLSQARHIDTLLSVYATRVVSTVQ
jgi:UDP-glucose:(heptosyl)LPS alpha-1,3-glucosyltransferase